MLKFTWPTLIWRNLNVKQLTKKILLKKSVLMDVLIEVIPQLSKLPTFLLTKKLHKQLMLSLSKHLLFYTFYVGIKCIEQTLKTNHKMTKNARIEKSHVGRLFSRICIARPFCMNGSLPAIKKTIFEKTI